MNILFEIATKIIIEEAYKDDEEGLEKEKIDDEIRKRAIKAMRVSEYARTSEEEDE